MDGWHRGDWLSSVYQRADCVLLLDTPVLRRYWRIIARSAGRKTGLIPDPVPLGGLKHLGRLLGWTHLFGARPMQAEIRRHSGANCQVFVIRERFAFQALQGRQLRGPSPGGGSILLSDALWKYGGGDRRCDAGAGSKTAGDNRVQKASPLTERFVVPPGPGVRLSSAALDGARVSEASRVTAAFAEPGLIVSPNRAASAGEFSYTRRRGGNRWLPGPRRGRGVYLDCTPGWLTGFYEALGFIGLRRETLTLDHGPYGPIQAVLMGQVAGRKSALRIEKRSD